MMVADVMMQTVRNRKESREDFQEVVKQHQPNGWDKRAMAFTENRTEGNITYEQCVLKSKIPRLGSRVQV
jgi:hypothetical protein